MNQERCSRAKGSPREIGSLIVQSRKSGFHQYISGCNQQNMFFFSIKLGISLSSTSKELNFDFCMDRVTSPLSTCFKCFKKNRMGIEAMILVICLAASFHIYVFHPTWDDRNRLMFSGGVCKTTNQDRWICADIRYIF